MGSGSATDQLAFDLDEALLRDTTFVVVDLETTGGRARGDADGRGADAITGIGAVKIRGGQVIGELATLIDAGRLEVVVEGDTLQSTFQWEPRDDAAREQLTRLLTRTPAAASASTAATV